jgi:hypothetical protein
MRIKKRKAAQMLAVPYPPECVSESQAEAAPSRKRPTAFSQYTDAGHTIRPIGAVRLISKLDPLVYKVESDMQGLYFSPHDMKTDNLLRFKDKRQKTVLSEIKKFWGLKARFNDMGFVHKRGLLLFGAPGTGKSCILKLVIADIIEEGDVVLSVQNPRLLVGALEAIRQIEPCRRVLAILEDVDEMVRYDEHALLGLFDGDAQQDSICLLGTTNYLDRLPPRMLRTGRFDRVIEIGNPGRFGRRAYFDSKLKGKERDEIISHLVNLTKGLNFSQLKEVLVSVYCLGYPLGRVMERIAKGIEPLELKGSKNKAEYIDQQLDSITTAMAVQANVRI